ncbi:hypothetical protein BNJ_00297 [Kaumoebavirus]|uniref:hypothetical protein n=1 Tax=Kaumoebavirus TaxID=1859492 RepID=UPI0009C3B758|nr:hypothetical protein BNJ_00297 [Kaumoebavirus]ARA72119.1 hypothetical protein BNJ_00297 [Kaumoebavirus]
MEQLIETTLLRLRARLPADVVYAEEKTVDEDGDLEQYVLRVSRPSNTNYQAMVLFIWTEDDTIDMTWGDHPDDDFCLCDEYCEEGDADEHIALFAERILSKI